MVRKSNIRYRSMDKTQLEKEVETLRLRLIESYGKMEMNKKKGGISLPKKIRKEIARIKTILKEKDEI